MRMYCTKTCRVIDKKPLSLAEETESNDAMDYGINDYYFSALDLSPLLAWIRREGKTRLLEKKDYLVRQNETSPAVGILEEGICRFVRTDGRGNEHVVGYTFSGSPIGEYTANLCSRPSLVDIQAVTRCRLCMVPYVRLKAWMDNSAEGMQMARMIAEQMFVMSYQRLLENYCCTPEERYQELMARYPELKELRPLKEIASFIGVTPETVSMIRRKLRGEAKS